MAISTHLSATPADRTSRHARMSALFATHASDVYAFALRRTSRSAAEDVVSETFLVAWRRLDSVPDAAKPWLLAVARRVLANQRRSEGRQSLLHTRLAGNEHDAGDGESPMLQPTDTLVLAALDALSIVERDAITLIAWDGLTVEEAATVLDCSRAAFYVRFHRARRHLAAGLGPSNTHPNEQGD